MKYVELFENHNKTEEARIKWNKMTRLEKEKFIKGFKHVKDDDIKMIAREPFGTLDYFLSTDVKNVINKLCENLDVFNEENWDEEEYDNNFEQIIKKFLDKFCWEQFYVYIKKINLGYCDYNIRELDEKNLIMEADINYGVQGEYDEKSYVVANKRAMVDYLNGTPIGDIESTGDSEEDGPYLDMGAYDDGGY